MSTAGEEPGELRIGGWLPPAELSADADDDQVTQLIPAVPTQPRSGSVIGDDGGTPLSGARRPGRRVLLAVVASVTTVAVAAGVPLLISAMDQPDPPNQLVLPAPSASAGPDVTPSDLPTSRPTKPPASRGAVRPPAHAPTSPARTTATRQDTAAKPTTQVLEAEAADLDGWARTRRLDSASGGQVVTGIGYRRGELTFSGVNAPRGGQYDLVLSYVADDSRRASIEVNGQSVGRFDFPSTGSWQTVKTMTVRLPLAAGPNTVELSNSDGWAPDFDRIALTTTS
ncbi:carbohydrate-binding protein [Asanoa sp. NPDC049518]|uniref:carbohydrate-binding protein n=1 Tax=unclassified Asanoa TaxID=2685164 RepID=UPI003423EA6A